MFTGIITDIGTIRPPMAGDTSMLRINCSYDVSGIKLGESIACNGACLTVVDKGDTWFAVQLSTETKHKTNPAGWDPGSRINLERALRAGDDLSGHLVTGHVDGTATLVQIIPGGEFYELHFTIDKPLHRFIALKGSVTLNGVSLTVNEVSGQKFSVTIIPHTWEQTNFHLLKEGHQVNLEVDLLARYTARLLETANEPT